METDVASLDTLRAMRKEHLEKKCRKCAHFAGEWPMWVCSETGLPPDIITGCIYFKPKAKENCNAMEIVH